MGEETTIAHPEDVGGEPPLDSGEEPTHRPAIAHPDVRHSGRIDIVAGEENIDGPLKVDDELHLVGAVPRVPVDHVAGPGPGSVDGNHHRAAPGELHRHAGHVPRARRHPVLEHDAGKGTVPEGTKSSPVARPPRGLAKLMVLVSIPSCNASGRDSSWSGCFWSYLKRSSGRLVARSWDWQAVAMAKRLRTDADRSSYRLASE